MLFELHESWKAKMHAHDRRTLRDDHVEHSASGFGGLERVNIEDHTGVRKRRLHLWNMYCVAPDQQRVRPR
jgi:hypothetical protein